MKKNICLILIAAFFLLNGCATKYYHATLNITNAFGAQVYYKVYQLDELSDPNSTSGDQVINAINPIHSPMDAGITDTIDLSWGGSYSYTRFKVSFGDTAATEGAYANMSTYYIVDDGTSKNITLGPGTAITVN